MSNAILYASLPGLTLYGVIKSPVGLYYNTGTVAFEAGNLAHWTAYAVALPAQTVPNDYAAPMPAGITAPGRYRIVVYLQSGTTPAYTDSVVDEIDLEWNGSAEQTAANLAINGAGQIAASNIPSNIVIQLSSSGANAVMTAGPKAQAIAIARGTDATLTFTFANSDGTARDITSVTAELLVKTNLSDADAAAIITLTTANGRITLPTPANGLMFAAILAADTALTTGAADSSQWYYYGLKVWNLGGQQLAEAGGAFRVTPFAVLGMVSP